MRGQTVTLRNHIWPLLDRTGPYWPLLGILSNPAGCGVEPGAAAPVAGRYPRSKVPAMTSETCVMLLVLAIIVASFLMDLHAYRAARGGRHVRRRGGWD